jgi:hypothetical protein
MSVGGDPPAEFGWNRDRHRPNMGYDDFFILLEVLSCQKMEMFRTKNRSYTENGTRQRT